MNKDMQLPEWMTDPLVQDIPQEKLELLQTLFMEFNQKSNTTKPKSQKEIMLTMMPLIKKVQTSGLTFTKSEMQSAIQAIRKYSSPEELVQFDKTYSKFTGNAANISPS